MNAAEYLIKQAVNVAQLAATAKANNIPLVGDWRYAARLLGKKIQATPAGQAHYDHVLGFSSQAQRDAVEQLRKQSITARGRINNWRELGVDSVDRYKKMEELVPERQRKALREFALYKAPGKETRGLIGSVGGAAMPFESRGSTDGLGAKLGIERTLHTHPDMNTSPRFRRITAMSQPHRQDPQLGHGFPSGPLDRPQRALTPEYNKRYQELEAAAFSAPDHSADGIRMLTSDQENAISLFSEHSRNPQYSPIAATPTVDSAIDQYKRMRIGPATPDAGDMAMLNTPQTATHTILTPHANQETVFKGNNGQLQRMYFRKYPQ